MGLSPELNRTCDAALMESKVGVACQRRGGKVSWWMGTFMDSWSFIRCLLKSAAPHCSENALQVSLKNVGEARSVVAACAALLRQRCAPRDIAVITPYKAQQHEIRARQGIFELRFAYLHCINPK